MYTKLRTLIYTLSVHTTSFLLHTFSFNFIVLPPIFLLSLSHCILLSFIAYSFLSGDTLTAYSSFFSLYTPCYFFSPPFLCILLPLAAYLVRCILLLNSVSYSDCTLLPLLPLTAYTYYPNCTLV